jgi:hypothetical protein
MVAVPHEEDIYDFDQCWLPKSNDDKIWLPNFSGKRDLKRASILLYATARYKGRGTKILTMCEHADCCNPNHLLIMPAANRLSELIEQNIVTQEQWDYFRGMATVSMKEGKSEEVAIRIAYEITQSKFGLVSIDLSMIDALKEYELVEWYRNLPRGHRTAFDTMVQAGLKVNVKPKMHFYENILRFILGYWGFSKEYAQLENKVSE